MSRLPWCRRGRHRRTLPIALLLAAGLAASVSAPSNTPAAAQRGPPTGPRVVLVGDSIAYRSRFAIGDLLGPTHPDPILLTAPGALVRPSIPDVVGVVSQPGGPRVVVVALGHAFTSSGPTVAGMESDLRAFLDAVTPLVDCVRWFDIKSTRTYYPNVNRLGRTFNRILREVASDYADVEVWHYSMWADLAPPTVWLEDLLHFTEEGKLEMGRMVLQAADGCDPVTSLDPWWDVNPSHLAAPAIDWLHTRGVHGFANHTYRHVVGSVDVPMNRGDVAEFLWRRAGSPAGFGRPPWSDVPPARRQALAWVAARSLFGGTNEARYGTSTPATRAHLITLLWRLAGRPTGYAPAPWSDTPPHLRDAAAWLAAAGYDEVLRLRLRPNRVVTRTLAARLLAPASVGAPAPAPPEASTSTAEYLELPSFPTELDHPPD